MDIICDRCTQLGKSSLVHYLRLEIERDTLSPMILFFCDSDHHFAWIIGEEVIGEERRLHAKTVTMACDATCGLQTAELSEDDLNVIEEQIVVSQDNLADRLLREVKRIRRQLARSRQVDSYIDSGDPAGLHIPQNRPANLGGSDQATYPVAAGIVSPTLDRRTGWVVPEGTHGEIPDDRFG